MCILACVLFLYLVVVPNCSLMFVPAYMHTQYTHMCIHVPTCSCVLWSGVECIMCKPFLYLELCHSLTEWDVRCFVWGGGRRHSNSVQYVTFVSEVVFVYEEDLLVVWHCSLKFPPIHAIHKVPPTYICTYMWTYLLLATAHVVVSVC